MHFLPTYSGRFVAEEERLVGQQLRQYLQVVLSKFLDLFRLVYADALRFELLATLEPLDMRHPYQQIT